MSSWNVLDDDVTTLHTILYCTVHEGRGRTDDGERDCLFTAREVGIITMVAAESCNFGASPLSCIGAAISNQIARSISGSPGADNQISVGWGGGEMEIPMLPACALLIAVIAGNLLRLLFGRPRWLPKSLSSLGARLCLFVGFFACMISVVKRARRR